MLASLEDHCPAITELLKAGASIDLPDFENLSPLDKAIEQRR